METPSPKQQSDETRFVEPSLRPSPEQPSPHRLAVGVTLLLIGFVAIFFAGSGALGQTLLIGGSILAIVSLFILRPRFRIGFHRGHDRHDMRKLYGTNNSANITRMECRHTTHTGVVLIVAIALTLLHTAADCFAANPYIGTWKFNDANSKMRPEVTRNSTITYAEQGDYIKVTMDGTNTGKRIRGVWVGKFDGKAYPVKGNPYHDAEGMRVINDHTLFIQGLKDGKVMWWGTITISKDGKTRTALLHSIDSHGKKQTVTKVYDRL